MHSSGSLTAWLLLYPSHLFWSESSIFWPWKKMGDEHSWGKKASLFPLQTQITFLCASRSDVNNRKYYPASITLSKAICDSPPWPIWASVQRESQKFESDSLSSPHTLRAHASAHRQGEPQTGWGDDRVLLFWMFKIHRRRQKLIQLSYFACVLHKMPKLKDFFQLTNS